MSGFDSATIFWRVLGPDQLTSAAVSWKATADPVDWMTILLPRHLVHGPWYHTYMCHTYWPCPLMAKKATIWAEQLALEHVAEGDLVDGYALKNNVLIFRFSVNHLSWLPYFNISCSYTPLSFKICFLLWKLYTKIIGKIQAGWRHRGSSIEGRCHGQGQAQDKQNNHSGNILARLPRSREVWFFFISFSRWRLNSRLRKPIALNANLCCD